MSAVEAVHALLHLRDLRISEVVDVPNWVVSFYFPQAVFE
jgi:amidase